jgi:hypothetical protein
MNITIKSILESYKLSEAFEHSSKQVQDDTIYFLTDKLTLLLNNMPVEEKNSKCKRKFDKDNGIVSYNFVNGSQDKGYNLKCSELVEWRKNVLSEIK